jgi:P pilus assembly chaperone PapD
MLLCHGNERRFLRLRRIEARLILIYYGASYFALGHIVNIKRPILLLLAILSLVPALAQAGAVLFIHPTLVVFEGNERSATITLSNRGDQTGTFEMSWTDMTMTPDGGLVKNEDPGPWSLQSYVRYSPRRVTLAPAEAQVIRIAVRRGTDIPEGEYYSHFRVLTLNSEDPAAEEDTAEDVNSAVVIRARSAVAIPIVWRNSRASSSASIEAVRIDHDTNQLNVDVLRHGPLSVRGYLHVFEMTADGARSPLAEPVPLVIYPNLDARTMTIALNDGVTAGSLKRGTEVYYSTDLEMSDRSVVIDSYAIVP